ncbi:MAG: hypothetical protein ABW003_05310, partial [Microvirga sp.]
IDWPQLSAEIRFRRAGGRCEACGRRTAGSSSPSPTVTGGTAWTEAGGLVGAGSCSGASRKPNGLPSHNGFPAFILSVGRWY